MATFTAASGDYIRPHRYVRLRQFPVDTGQTIILGDLIVLSADANEGNRVKKASADPTADRGIVGIAAEGITTGGTFDEATDKINVWVATGDAEFRGRVQDTGAIDMNDIGKEFGMVEDTTNKIWRVDLAEVTAKLVRILEIVPPAVDADVNAEVVFHFIAPERLYHD